jgi:hypothetical protein
VTTTYIKLSLVTDKKGIYVLSKLIICDVLLGEYSLLTSVNMHFLPGCNCNGYEKATRKQTHTFAIHVAMLSVCIFLNELLY